MSVYFRYLKRAISGSVALLFLLAMVLPSFSWNNVLAAQMSSRSITMSDSAESGGAIATGVGSGTNVTYKVSFTTSNTANSLIIDFCYLFLQ